MAPFVWYPNGKPLTPALLYPDQLLADQAQGVPLADELRDLGKPRLDLGFGVHPHVAVSGHDLKQPEVGVMVYRLIRYAILLDDLCCRHIVSPCFLIHPFSFRCMIASSAVEGRNPPNTYCNHNKYTNCAIYYLYHITQSNKIFIS